MGSHICPARQSKASLDHNTEVLSEITLRQLPVLSPATNIISFGGYLDKSAALKKHIYETAKKNPKQYVSDDLTMSVVITLYFLPTVCQTITVIKNSSDKLCKHVSSTNLWGGAVDIFEIQISYPHIELL